VPTPDLQLTTVPEHWRPSDQQLVDVADFLLTLVKAQPDNPPPAIPCGCLVPHRQVRQLLVGVLRMEANGLLELELT
jgi:hypothetical protein